MTTITQGALEEQRLAAKEIEAPQAVLGVAEDAEPGGAATAGRAESHRRSWTS